MNIVFVLCLVLLAYTGYTIYDVHRNTITGMTHYCLYALDYTPNPVV